MSCKKRPPTKEMMLIIDRRQRGDPAFSRRGQGPRRPKDPPQEEVRRYTEMLSEFKRAHGGDADGWTAVQCVVTLLKEGTLQDHKMVWLYRMGASSKYFVDEDRGDGFEEFYVWGGLENTARVVRLSLGVARRRGSSPAEFVAASEAPAGSVSPLEGFVVRILAHEPEIPEPLDNGQFHFQKAAHIEEVLRKKTLHCDSVSWCNDQIPKFAVLRPAGYKRHAETLGRLQADEAEWEEALQHVQRVPTPWSLLNALPADALAAVRAAAAQDARDAVVHDGETEVVVEKMPHSTSAYKTTAWWAAEQSQRSASIPPAFLYEPVVLEGPNGGEYFELMRFR